MTDASVLEGVRHHRFMINFVRRRELLFGVALSVAASFARPVALASTAAPIRRRRPSDAAWPSQADWQGLREAVGGNLFQVQDLLGDCTADANGAACAQVMSGLRNPYYVGDQPAGTQVSGWVDAWSSTPSVYALAARSAADVVAAVNFARERNLRLVVKGGGHSYQGTSNAADSLLIWTRHMNDVLLHDAFVASGCDERQSPTHAVSLGAGAMWMDAYDAVTTKGGRYVQGGGCATVGVAGLIQSGGFGTYSKGFGTSAGSLLEAEIVTADGVARIANACTNPDLFWAIKGGGGGSWGVITRVTLQTHALPAWFGSAYGTIRATSDAAFRRLLARFFAFYVERLHGPHWGEQIKIGGRNTLKVSMECQGLDSAEINELWRPFFEFVRQSPHDFLVRDALGTDCVPAQHGWDTAFWNSRADGTITSDPRPGAPAWHAWWTGDQDQLGEFIHGYHSTWLPASLLRANQQERLVDTLFAASRQWTIGLHFNKGLAGAPPDAIERTRNTATNPAALDAFALAIVSGEGPPAFVGMPAPDSGAARANAAFINTAAAAVRALAPAPASYLSESDYFEPDWRHAFWGSNYARLRRVKHRYDPHGLFFVHHGVGSENWSADGFTQLV